MKLCLTGPQILWLFDWHGGQSDPVYAVASRAYRPIDLREPATGTCLEISEGEYEALRTLAYSIREERPGYRATRADRRRAATLLRRLGPREI